MTVYTDENVVEMVQTYQASVDAGDKYDQRAKVVADLAEKFEVSVPSMRQKLVVEGVYVPKETKTTKSSTSKEDLVAAYQAVSGLELNSFKNVSRKDLQAFWDFFVTASEAGNLKAAS